MLFAIIAERTKVQFLMRSAIRWDSADEHANHEDDHHIHCQQRGIQPVC